MGKFLDNITAKNKGKVTSTKSSVSSLYRIEKNNNGIDDFIVNSTDCYFGNMSLLKKGVKFKLTAWMESEYSKCEKDILYFVQNYIYIPTLDEGTKKFSLWKFQKKLLKGLIQVKRENNVILWPRQSGKTYTTAAYLLWCLIFENEFKIGVTANSEDTAKDYMSKIQEMIYALPKWMQNKFDGIKSWNKKQIIFGNNSSLICAPSTDSQIRGKSFHLTLVDECAFVENWKDFKAALFPTTSNATNPKKILMSTPNGTDNHFFDYWNRCLDKNSDWFGYTIKWQDVPRKVSNAKFKKKKIEEIGQAKWDQEFELNFDKTGSLTLIDPDILKTLKTKKVKEKIADLLIYEQYDENRKYIAFVDVAEGTGFGDYSVINVFDVTNWKKKVKQVAVWRSRNVEVGLLWQKVSGISKLYRCFSIIESNLYGDGVIKDLLRYDENALFTTTEGALKFGTNKVTKNEACAALKTFIEDGFIEVVDEETISELFSFRQKENREKGSWGATNGHDDICTTLWILAYQLRKNTALFEDDIVRQNIDNEEYNEDEPLEPMNMSDLDDDELNWDHLRDEDDPIMETRRSIQNIPGFFG